MEKTLQIPQNMFNRNLNLKVLKEFYKKNKNRFGLRNPITLIK